MKKILPLLIFALVLCLAVVHAMDIGKTIIVPKTVCFTNTPDKYPAAASLDAPIVDLDTTASAPVLYRQISSLTKSQRVLFFQALSPTAKSQVWAQHILSYMERHGLTQPQSDFLINAVKELYRNAYNKESLHAHFAPLKADAIKLFGNEAYWELFLHLGGASGLPENRQSVQYALPGVIVPGVALPPACECGIGGPNLCWDPAYECRGVPTNVCTWTPDGCGFLWADPCSGMCLAK